MMRGVRGFTLIEVAIVVVIVGILSVIGVVTYRRYMAASRLAEATHMLGGIATAEQEWKSERGVYFNVSDNSGAFYPNPTPGPQVTQWGGPCGNCGGNPHAWEELKVHADGPVLFGYSATAAVGVAGPALFALGPGPGITPPPGSGPDINNAVASLQNSAVASTSPWFLIVARADYDGNGRPCTVVGMSHMKELVVEASGE